MVSRYEEVYEGWRRDPEAFWRDAAEAIDWIETPKKIFNPDAGVAGRWFPDATCNTCYNAIDRHVAGGRAAQTALIYDSPVTGSKQSFTYADLLERVGALAAVLHDDFGVRKGDRVVIYMPMVPEAIFAMLACARIGAIHSVVFGGFAARELATRIDDARPKLILSASCGIEPGRVVDYKPLLDGAIEQATHKPDACIVFQRPQGKVTMVEGRDHDWATLADKALADNRSVPCEELGAEDPLYIIYTSGTTGIPKGVVRDNAGHMVALAWSMKYLYGVEPGEVFWAASDIGWVVGHSYIVYAPLIYGATGIVYEGKPVGTPDAGAFWRMIDEYKVSALFVAPTAFRAIKKVDPDAKLLAHYDVKSLRTLFLAGERADPDTIAWAEEKLKVPVIDHWWQTETGWCIVGNPVGLGQLPVKHGSPTVPLPGWDLDVLDPEAKPVGPNEMGAIVLKLPLPPGSLTTLWQADERMRESYLSEFPGYYTTSDAGFRDADGYVFVMGRTDDIINVAGHRLSTGGMEEVLAGHAAVAECAVIGIKDSMKGEVPCGFVVLKSGTNRDPSEVEKEVVALVRDKIGPVAAFKTAIVIERLPKTRSGKILRGTMKKIVDRDAWSMPATVDDPAIFGEIEEAARARGL